MTVLGHFLLTGLQPSMPEILLHSHTSIVAKFTCFCMGFIHSFRGSIELRCVKLDTWLENLKLPDLTHWHKQLSSSLSLCAHEGGTCLSMVQNWRQSVLYMSLSYCDHMMTSFIVVPCPNTVSRFIKASPCQAEDLWAFAELESCQRCPALCKPPGYPIPLPPNPNTSSQPWTSELSFMKNVQVIFSGSKPQDFIMLKS